MQRSTTLSGAPQQVTPQQIQLTQQTQHYEGPVPHPDTLRGFDALVPGSAQKLIDLALSESLHRRDLESKAVDANIATQKRQLDIANKQSWIVFASDVMGQILGFTMSGACIAGAVWLALHDREVTAVALASLPIAAIAKAFFTPRNGNPPKS